MTWKNLLSDHGLLLMRKDLSHYPNDQDEMKNKKKVFTKRLLSTFSTWIWMDPVESEIFYQSQIAMSDH